MIAPHKPCLWYKWVLPPDGWKLTNRDHSGNGNDWTPVNFGASVALDSPAVSGARPILNTGSGGNVVRPGVFGSEVSKRIAVTVSNATGNNKYYFDTVLNPTFSLIRGATITFDTGDSSNNSHPFKLSSTNADSSNGTEYTDGVKYYINGSSVSGSDYVSKQPMVVVQDLEVSSGQYPIMYQPLIIIAPNIKVWVIMVD